MSAPTILILGGLAGDHTRLLLAHLFPVTTTASSTAAAEASFIRVVDKYLLELGNVYIDQATRYAFKVGRESGRLDYQQANLLNEDARQRAFTLPMEYRAAIRADGKTRQSFDYVFDFTGEVDPESSDAVFIERTLRLSLLLGQTAAKLDIGVYLRCLSKFYRTESRGKKVGEAGVESKPYGRRTGWIHESARGLARIEELKVVFVRPAIIYGGATLGGLMPRLLVGEIYKYKNEKLDFIWSESLLQNTLHATDFCRALLSIAAYALPLSRTALLANSSESLPSTLSSDTSLVGIEGAATFDAKVNGAVLTVVDDGETSQKDIAVLVSELIGVKVGFFGGIVDALAKLNMEDMVEDANDKHMEGWNELVSALVSHLPSLLTTPMSPYAASEVLQPTPISFSSAQLKALTDWTPMDPRLSIAEVRIAVDAFKHEGNWPVIQVEEKKKKSFFAKKSS